MQLSLQNKLGKGAYGTVYQAVDPISQEKYAIKLSEANDTSKKESIEKEFVLLDFLMQKPNFSSSHIIRHLNLIPQKDGKIGLVLELLGMDLDKYSQKLKGLSLEKTRQFTQQLAKGLAFLGANQVIHADLKPENILVSLDGNSVKISDFGIAFFTKKSNKRTSDLCYIQSLSYRSPEVILRIEAKPSIDIWSLGVVITSIYTRQDCFCLRKNTEDELINQHCLTLEKKYSEDFIEQGSPFGQKTFTKALQLERTSTKTLIQLITDTAKTKNDCSEKIQDLHNLLSQIFEYDPTHRISALQIQNSPFISGGINPTATSSSSTSSLPPLISRVNAAPQPSTRHLRPIGPYGNIVLVTENDKSFTLKGKLNTSQGLTSIIHETAILLFLKNNPKPCPQIIRASKILPSEAVICLGLEPIHEDLSNYLAQNPNNLTLNKIKNFTTQLTQALIFLDENHVIHREINTNRIFIDRTGEHIKLAQFQSAIFTFEAHEHIDTSNTLEFLENKSPEAILEIPLTTRSDIWALATVLVELCTKKILFPISQEEEDKNQALILRHTGTLDLPYDADLISQGSLKAQRKFSNISKKRPRVDTLPQILQTAAFHNPDNPEQSSLALHLLEQMLALDPKKRFTAKQVLDHPFLNEEQSSLNLL